MLIDLIGLEGNFAAWFPDKKCLHIYLLYAYRKQRRQPLKQFQNQSKEMYGFKSNISLAEN